jgi:hypothetical protein
VASHKFIFLSHNPLCHGIDVISGNVTPHAVGLDEGRAATSAFFVKQDSRWSWYQTAFQWPSADSQTAEKGFGQRHIANNQGTLFLMRFVTPKPLPRRLTKSKAKGYPLSPQNASMAPWATLMATK